MAAPVATSAPKKRTSSEAMNAKGESVGEPPRLRQRTLTEYGPAAPPRLQKVISGGQSGADRAGLQAARVVLLATGGWAPPGFVTAEGKKPELGTVFGLTELEAVSSHGGLAGLYVRRSMRNVDDSDGTIAFRLQPSNGTDSTIRYCKTGKWGGRGPGVHASTACHRPCLVVSDLSEDGHSANVESIVKFILEHGIHTLNVAGHRDDKTAGMTRFADAVRRTLISAFQDLLKPKDHY